MQLVASDWSGVAGVTARPQPCGPRLGRSLCRRSRRTWKPQGFSHGVALAADPDLCYAAPSGALRHRRPLASIERLRRHSKTTAFPPFSPPIERREGRKLQRNHYSRSSSEYSELFTLHFGCNSLIFRSSSWRS
jgi:hypothetical protein